MQVIAFRKGRTVCSADCPFYTEKGVVKGVRGVPLKTHCRMTMNPWMVDCDLFDTHHIFKLEVTEEEWKTMQAAIHKRAKKERKPWPEDHEEIHPVGWNWKHDRWKADKSANV